MVRREDAAEHLAQCNFQLYLTYGLGEFPNWLSQRGDLVRRDDVINSLRFTSVREMASQKIKACEHQIEELREMMAKADEVPGSNTQ